MPHKSDGMEVNMKARKLLKKVLSSVMVFSMVTSLFTGMEVTPVKAEELNSGFTIEAEYGDISGAEYYQGDFSNNCAVGALTDGSSVKIEGIVMDTAGSRNVRLYYGSGFEREVLVKVNGEDAQTISCPATDSWVVGDGNVSFTVNFVEGENDIEFIAPADGASPNIDRFTIALTDTEEQKTVVAMTNHLLDLKEADLLSDSDWYKVDAMRVTYNSMHNAGNVWIENRLNEIERGVNKNATFTYEAELGSPEGEVYRHEAKGASNGYKVGDIESGKITIEVYKETAGLCQMKIYYMSDPDGRYLAYSVNEGNQVRFEEKFVNNSLSDWAYYGDGTYYDFPVVTPVYANVSLEEGWNTISFFYPQGNEWDDVTLDTEFAPDIDRIQIDLSATEAAKTIDKMIDYANVNATKVMEWSAIAKAYSTLTEEAKAKVTNVATLKEYVDIIEKEDSDGAVATETYTVTFLNEDGTEYKVVNGIAAGKKIEEPTAPQKESYDFIGWYVATASDAGSYVATSEKMDFENTAITEDMVLIAVYEENALAKVIAEAERAIEESSELNEADYTDESWNTYQNILGELENELEYGEAASIDTINNLLEQLITARDNLIRVFTVTFLNEDGTLYKTVHGIKDGKIIEEPETPQKGSYKFVGWYVAEASDADSYVATSTKMDFENTAITEDMVLMAVYKDDALGEAIAKAEAVIRETYALYDSNYTEESWENVQDILDELEAEIALGDAADADIINELLEELLDARDNLQRKNFKVVFDSNGGSTIEAEEVKNGETAIEPKEPTKQNCIFGGWYLNGYKYDFETPITKDITLIAMWSLSPLAEIQREINELMSTMPSEEQKDKYTEASWNQMQSVKDKIQEELYKGDDADVKRLDSLRIGLRDAIIRLEEKTDITTGNTNGGSQNENNDKSPTPITGGKTKEEAVLIDLEKEYITTGTEGWFKIVTPEYVKFIGAGCDKYTEIMGCDDEERQLIVSNVLTDIIKLGENTKHWLSVEGYVHSEDILAGKEYYFHVKTTKAENCTFKLVCCIAYDRDEIQTIELNKEYQWFQYVQVGDNYYQLVAPQSGYYKLRIKGGGGIVYYKDNTELEPIKKYATDDTEIWERVYYFEQGMTYILELSLRHNTQITYSLSNTPVSEIKLNRTSLEMKKNEQYLLEPQVLPENAVFKDVKFSSEDPNVATVSEKGWITAISNGTTTIKCEADDGSGVLAECTVNVVGEKVQLISLDQKSLELDLEEDADYGVIGVRVYPEDADDKSVSWSSSNPEVVEVEKNGRLQLNQAGTAVITCRANDGSNVEATCTITVHEPVPDIPVSEIIMNSTNLTMKKNEQVLLKSQVLPENATSKEVHFSSSDPKVAKVSEEGLVTAVSSGTAIISCTAEDESGVSAQCIVNVPHTLVQRIDLSQTSLNLDWYEEDRDYGMIRAEVYPKDADNTEVSWSSSNPNVISVSQKGELYLFGVGTAVITCTAKDGSGVSARCIVNIFGEKVQRIRLAAQSLSLDLAEGADYDAIGVEVYPEDADNKSVSWFSSNPEVVSVAQNGRLHLNQIGTAIITCRANDGSNVEAACVVTVCESLSSGDKFVVSDIEYKVTSDSTGGGTVAVSGIKNTKKKSYVVPDEVSIKGCTYKVESIGKKAFSKCKKAKKITLGTNIKSIDKKAFYNCKKLKTLTIKSKKLVTVGNSALKNVHTNLKIKMPASNLATYKRLFANKGQKSTVKFKKI